MSEFKTLYELYDRAEKKIEELTKLLHDIGSQPVYPYQDGDFIVLGPETFIGKDRTSITHKGEIFLKHANPLKPQLCQYCGNEICFHYSDAMNKQLAEDHNCFSCNFWKEQSDAVYESEAYTRPIIEGRLYKIETEPVPLPKPNEKYLYGFDGMKHVIEFNDGPTIVTHNLWTQGAIPAIFRDELPDNAKFVK